MQGEDPNPDPGTIVTLVNRRYLAKIGTRGAALRQLVWGAEDLVVPSTPELSLQAFSGRILAPWPNRLRSGEYTWNGVDYRVPVTEAATGTALMTTTSAGVSRAGRDRRIMWGGRTKPPLEGAAKSHDTRELKRPGVSAPPARRRFPASRSGGDNGHRRRPRHPSRRHRQRSLSLPSPRRLRLHRSRLHRHHRPPRKRRHRGTMRRPSP